MRQEKGFSLIEVAIAIALLGIVAVAVLGALATGSRGIFIADERATAESLARTEMEYVRSQEYSTAPWDYTVTSSQRSSTDQPFWWDDDPPPLLSSNYEGYTAYVSTATLHILAGHPIDDGIQKIIVVIKHLDEEIFTLEGYRVWR
jgi:prepilin-type N-terminal cleavage/methylation domain-containing protein